MITEGGASAAPRAGQPGQRFSLAPGAALRLDFGCGARVEVSGPALFALSVRSDQGLLVHRGTARVELPPGATRAAGPCWLATPSLRVSLGFSARLALHVGTEGRTHLAVVSGRVSRENPDGEGPGATGPAPVEAGRRVTAEVGQPVTEVEGPTTLPAALAFLDGAAAEAAVAAPRDLLGVLGTSLDVAVANFGRAEERARSLDVKHRRLVAADDPRAREVQREIALHAAQMFRSRRRLEAVLASLEAARLGLADAAAPDPRLGSAADLLR